ncbi:ABC transporter permease (plasmid) [Corynebacterium sp. S7]
MTTAVAHAHNTGGTAIEFAKLRRTRIVLMGILLSAGITLFASMNLFAGGQIDAFREDPHSSWAGYLISYCMALAFLSPLQLAMLASRSADAEHNGGGWRLNAVASIRPGTLVRRKFIVLAIIVGGLKTLEFISVLTVPILLGGPAPDSSMLVTWAITALGAYGTSLAVLAVLLWLAARIESQLVVLGIGVIGGFLGIAALLSPPWLAAINPFGYYAMVIPYGFSDSGVVSVNPNWLLWIMYLSVAAIAFVNLTSSLNHKEL